MAEFAVMCILPLLGMGRGVWTNAADSFLLAIIVLPVLCFLGFRPQTLIEMIDNGVGIPADNLTKIFSYGFTTKEDGHGIGLHSAALTAKEMGGALTAHSDGPGKGATFTLDLPFEPAEVEVMV